MSVLSNRQRFNGTFGAVRGQDGGNGPRKTIKLTKENVEEVEAAENPAEAEEYTGKEYQAFIYQILSDKTRQATEEELDLVAISQIIEPSKLRKYLTMHNELVQDVKKMKEENLEFHTENKSLQDQLTMEMMKNPATETITSARLEYEVRQTEKKKELEMKAIKKDHKAQGKKIEELSRELFEQRELLRMVKDSISGDDITRKEKTQNLEQNVLQLQQLFQKAQKDAEIVNLAHETTKKKVVQRDERIKNLETKLLAAKKKQ